MNITENQTITKDFICNWLCEWLANQLNKPVEIINPNQSFISYTLDSIIAMSLVGDLEDYLGCRLSPTLAWDYPTIVALAEDLANRNDLIINKSNGQNYDNANELLEKLDDLSEAEMDALLAKLSA
jgi:acyl carrier protein